MSLDKLQKVLDELIQIYEKAIVVAREKNIFLTASDINNLEQLIKKEELVVKTANQLEISRRSVVQELAKGYNLPWKDLTLNKLLTAMPEKEARPLNEKATVLKEKIYKLAEMNELNAEMLKKVISFVNYNINVLTRASSGPTYSDVKGEKPSGQTNNRLFDARC